MEMDRSQYQIVINQEHLVHGNVWASLSYRIEIIQFTCVQYAGFGILVKFLRYRGSVLDRVPIIKPALREARMDRVAGCQNHEQNRPVSNKTSKTSSRLVREQIAANNGVTAKKIFEATNDLVRARLGKLQQLYNEMKHMKSWICTCLQRYIFWLRC